jgi:hypothetical protein
MYAEYPVLGPPLDAKYKNKEKYKKAERREEKRTREKY